MTREEIYNTPEVDMPNYNLTIDDFDLSDYEYTHIKRIYDGFWIILAQSEQDYTNKVNCIKRGDRKGFLTIKRAKRKINMKLYTEEQVDKIALQVKNYGYWDNREVTPIELPSDEEIYDESILVNQNITIFNFDKVSFQLGAKWMRDKIQGGNNESN